MTSPQTNTPLKTVRKTLLTLAAATMIMPAMAMAGDAPSGLTVKSTTNGYIKMSVKAFNKGEFERSASLSKRALKDGLSKRRRAIALSNLCAAEAAMGNMDAAAEACGQSLELRPGYELAQANKSALTVLLAQK